MGWSVAGSGDSPPADDPLIITMGGSDVTVRARFASPVALAQGMVAFWRGETDATDLIGGHSGTFYQGNTPTTPSVTHRARSEAHSRLMGQLMFRYLIAPALRPQQFTLEAWVYPTVVNASAQTVIGSGSSDQITQTWWLGLAYGTPRFISDPDDVELNGPAAIPLNTWTHLAATFDGTTILLYVNGTEVASQGGLGPLTYDPEPIPVTIGAAWQLNAPTDGFPGLVDEISLYSRALTCDEIFDIYNADIAGKNVVAPYFTTISPLPAAATTGPDYSQQLTTVLGTAPITFTRTDGALPPGITLSPAGTLTGQPDVPGIFDFTATASDAAGNTTEQLYVLPVDA